MITKFKNYLITENPDKINLGWEYVEYDNDDALPFFCTVNSDHTEVNKMYIGEYGKAHNRIKYDGNFEDKAYPGRLFFDNKVMSFWVYPNEKLFVSIIKKLEQFLDVKLFNDGWRIEIIENNNGDIEKMKFDPKKSCNYFDGDYWGNKNRLIPIEEYVVSENVPEEQKILHMMNWKEKELAKKRGELDIKGWGSNKTAWDSPNNLPWRQAIYQEKKNNDK